MQDEKGKKKPWGRLRFYNFASLLSFVRSLLRQVNELLTLYHTIPTFNDPEKEGLENHGKTRKWWLPAFSPFPIIISTLAKTNFNFSITFILSSPNGFNLDKFKNLSLGKELTTLDRLISVFRISSRRNIDERRGNDLNLHLLNK